MFSKPIKKEFEKVSDPDGPINEKYEISTRPQVGHGIFPLLASTVLPALVSLFTRWRYDMSHKVRSSRETDADLKNKRVGMKKLFCWVAKSGNR